MNQGGFRTQPRAGSFVRKGVDDRRYVDYKDADELRRLMTPNGKIYSRKRTGLSSADQRLVAQAIKQARFMALLPFTSATL